MTGTSAKNTFGIFKSRRAKLLAIRYNLDLYNTNAYVHKFDYITYADVQFIVDNLWLDHFTDFTPPPIKVDIYEYNSILNRLCSRNTLINQI